MILEQNTVAGPRPQRSSPISAGVCRGEKEAIDRGEWAIKTSQSCPGPWSCALLLLCMGMATLLLSSVWESVTLRGGKTRNTRAPQWIHCISPTAAMMCGWGAEDLCLGLKHSRRQTVSCTGFVLNGLCIQIFPLSLTVCLTLRN